MQGKNKRFTAWAKPTGRSGGEVLLALCQRVLDDFLVNVFVAVRIDERRRKVDAVIFTTRCRCHGQIDRR